MCGPFLLSYAASWSGAASVVFRFRGTRPVSVPSGAWHMSGSAGRARVRPFQTAGAHVGISWTRPRLSSSRRRGHMSGSTGRARVRPFRCVAHVGISWTRPRPSLPDSGGTCRDQLDAPASVLFQTAGAHVGINWTRPRPPLPVRGTSRASAASGMAWHGRQGTTGPGDALMVGIPAARLCF